MVHSILIIWRYADYILGGMQQILPELFHFFPKIKCQMYLGICVETWNIMYTFYMKNKQTFDQSVDNKIIPLYK